MKRGRVILSVVLILGVAVGLWRVRESPGEADPPPNAGSEAGEVDRNSGKPETPAAPDAGTAAPPADAVAAPATPRPVAPAPLAAPNPPSPQRHSPAAPPLPAEQRPAAVVPEPAQAAVEALALNIREYRNRFGGNPVGNNAEIVREMDGGNAKGAAYLPADLKRLNGQGELIDEWGTPYFFHQESAKEMEIRSAGADRVLWTSDDIVAR
jgi:hypothetical protein